MQSEEGTTMSPMARRALASATALFAFSLQSCGGGADPSRRIASNEEVACIDPTGDAGTCSDDAGSPPDGGDTCPICGGETSFPDQLTVDPIPAMSWNTKPGGPANNCPPGQPLPNRPGATTWLWNLAQCTNGFYAFCANAVTANPLTAAQVTAITTACGNLTGTAQLQCVIDQVYALLSGNPANVCRQYSLAVNQVLAALGITSSLTIDCNNSHAWNTVTIGGACYYVDALNNIIIPCAGAPGGATAGRNAIPCPVPATLNNVGARCQAGLCPAAGNWCQPRQLVGWGAYLCGTADNPQTCCYCTCQ
jgi:hypothetical protein